MNRPSHIEENFLAAGVEIPKLAVVGHVEDPDFPLHVYEPEIGWIVWSNPWMN